MKLHTLDDPQKKGRTNLARYSFCRVEEELEIFNLLDVRRVVGQKVVPEGRVVLDHEKEFLDDV